MRKISRKNRKIFRVNLTITPENRNTIHSEIPYRNRRFFFRSVLIFVLTFGSEHCLGLYFETVLFTLRQDKQLFDWRSNLVKKGVRYVHE